MTFVNPIEGASVENATNAMVILPPPPPDFTNGLRGSQRREPHPDETNSTNITSITITNLPGTNVAGEQISSNTPPPDSGNRPRIGGRGRPPWLRAMSDADYKAYIARHELHGLVLTMSTENFQAICTRDLWMRFIIIFFAGISAVGVGLAWRNTKKTSELQIRLVRASELNSHLKEMNLAAAGLAHETRNPLNIIRGMAQMLSKESAAPVEIRDKARAIVDETDKVTVQLNEFINYSRPREVRRTKLALNSAVGEVVRALNHDIEEKKIRVETKGDLISIEADEQLLRQVLFNLLLNAIQAVDGAGEIQVVTGTAKFDGGVSGNPRQRPRRSARTPQGNFQALLHHAPKGNRPRPRGRAADCSGARLGNRMSAQRTQRRRLPHHPLETGCLTQISRANFAHGIRTAQKIRRVAAHPDC